MKATTCVRVVLPTDELVRVECIATMTVADIVTMLGKRSNLREMNGVERNGDSGQNPFKDNNHDTDPATETSLGCRSKGSLPKSVRGKLVLVRQEEELDPGSLLLGEVEELDILEFQLVDSNASGGAPERMCQNSCRRTSQNLNSSPQCVVEEVRPVSTTLIPLWRVKQDKRWEGRAASQSFTGGAESRNLEPIKGHSEVRGADLVQKSRAGWSTLRRRARKHPTSRIKRKYLLSTDFQERRQASKVHKTAERILFQAGMQLIECTQFLQNAVRKLVFLLRDAILGNSSLNFGELLAILRTMVKTLTDTRLESSPMTSSTTIDADENLVRRLSWDIAGKDGGVTILIEGWVVTAEWGTFWRTQRKEYACLCDNHMLYFFTNRTQCADFIFELGRERDGNASDISKRILKDTSPLSHIDLSETDWSVRKSIQLEEDSHEAHRNAFAFFDSNGSMKLVLDVNTAAEATAWARLIAAEVNRNKLFTRMRELNEQELKPEEDTSKADPLHAWTEIMVQSSATTGEQHSLIIPLRALYSRIDRLSGTARAERYKSWTLNQALKDLQRDRVKINGLLLSGASLETNILALALEILKCPDDISAKTTHGETTPFVSMAAKEMTALRFARQVIICSSRTHGGGDILDTLHLLFGHKRFCICPDAQSMEPVEIEISHTHGATATLCARITMRMTYRVIPSDSIGPIDDQTLSIGDNGGDASNPVCAENQSVQNGDLELFVAKEFKVLGTYTQTLACHLIETNYIDGTVQLQFAGYDASPEPKGL